jgi:cytochrome c-type biogenesis protein CcmH/NrfG
VTVSSLFELTIGPENSATDTFLVRVIRAAAGEASASIVLDLPQLLAARADVQRAVLASASAGGPTPAKPDRTLRSVGSTLFTALLGTADVHGCYRGALALADQRGENLRVVIRPESVTLATLPWEAMFDPARGDYVCLRDQIVRHLPVPAVPAPLQVQAPLHLLAVTASPRGLAPLNVTRERTHLERALGPLTRAGLVTVDWVEQAGWADLQRTLMRRPYHCLHFIGHGDYDEETDQGTLTLVGMNESPEVVEAYRFVNLLRTARPIPRLVLLNSCLGAAGGAEEAGGTEEAGAADGTDNLFAGTASALVRGGVGAVVAMQYGITDAACLEFTRGFYTGIAHGRGVDEAVVAGRVAILGMNGRTLEWLTPALYLRGDNSQLFTISLPDAADEPLVHADRTAPGNSDEAERLRRAERLQRQRRWAEAETAFQEAIRLAPASAAAYFGLGNTQWGQRRPADAQAAFREAIRLAPEHPEPRCGLGNALRDAGQPIEAEAAYREAIQLAPEHAIAHYGLGSALRDQHRFCEAEVAFKESIRLAPERPHAYRGLGRAFSDQGQDAQALACHRKAEALEADRRAEADAASDP